MNLDLPLFPNYVFVRIDLRERVRVLEVPGVLSLVSFGRSPRRSPISPIDPRFSRCLSCCPPCLHDLRHHPREASLYPLSEVSLELSNLGLTVRVLYCTYPGTAVRILDLGWSFCWLELRTRSAPSRRQFPAREARIESSRFRIGTPRPCGAHIL